MIAILASRGLIRFFVYLKGDNRMEKYYKLLEELNC